MDDQKVDGPIWTGLMQYRARWRQMEGKRSSKKRDMDQYGQDWGDIDLQRVGGHAYWTLYWKNGAY